MGWEIYLVHNFSEDVDPEHIGSIDTLNQAFEFARNEIIESYESTGKGSYEDSTAPLEEYRKNVPHGEEELYDFELYEQPPENTPNNMIKLSFSLDGSIYSKFYVIRTGKLDEFENGKPYQDYDNMEGFANQEKQELSLIRLGTVTLDEVSSWNRHIVERYFEAIEPLEPDEGEKITYQYWIYKNHSILFIDTDSFSGIWIDWKLEFRNAESIRDDPIFPFEVLESFKGRDLTPEITL